MSVRVVSSPLWDARAKLMGCGASSPAPPAVVEAQPGKAVPEPAAKLPQPATSTAATSSAASPPTTIVPAAPVVFVLGGPGAGKGTHCAKLVEKYGCAHFSTSELLKTAVKSNSERGVMIANMIKQGQIVPAQVSLDLLKDAMGARTDVSAYLVDGFPRSMDNLEAFEQQCGACKLALHLAAAEGSLSERCLERGKSGGRTDDNPETVQRRIRTFNEQTMPVIRKLEERGLVGEVDAGSDVDTTFAALCAAWEKSVAK